MTQYKKDLERYGNDKSEYEKKIKKGQEKVKELNDRFGPWYYVISAESFENLRLTHASLVKPKEAPGAKKDAVTSRPRRSRISWKVAPRRASTASAGFGGGSTFRRHRSPGFDRWSQRLKIAIVLLVAAELSERRLLFGELLEAGYDVLPVAGFAPALGLLLQHAVIPRLILLDVQGDEHATPQSVEHLLAQIPRRSVARARRSDRRRLVGAAGRPRRGPAPSTDHHWTGRRNCQTDSFAVPSDESGFSRRWRIEHPGSAIVH